jgi:hypothetical protein
MAVSYAEGWYAWIYSNHCLIHRNALTRLAREEPASEIAWFILAKFMPERSARREGEARSP